MRLFGALGDSARGGRGGARGVRGGVSHERRVRRFLQTRFLYDAAFDAETPGRGLVPRVENGALGVVARRRELDRLPVVCLLDRRAARLHVTGDARDV